MIGRKRVRDWFRSQRAGCCERGASADVLLVQDGKYPLMQHTLDRSGWLPHLIAQRPRVVVDVPTEAVGSAGGLGDTYAVVRHLEATRFYNRLDLGRLRRPDQDDYRNGWPPS